MSSSRRPVLARSAKKRAVSIPSPKPAVKKAVAKKAVSKTPVKNAVAKKAVSKTPVKNAVAKKAVSKTPVKKAVAKKAVAKVPAKKAVSKTSVKKAVAQTPAKPHSKSTSSSVAKKTAQSRSSVAPAKVVKVSQPVEKKVLLKKSQDAVSKSKNETVEKSTPTKSTPTRPAGVARAIFRDVPVKPVAERPNLVTHVELPRESAPNLVSDDDPGFLDSSEVFDETDHAQHQQLREQAAIQERARQMARPQTHPDFDGIHCVDCDDEIPAFRLKIGRVRCVDCQQALEDKDRHKAGHTSAGPRVPEDWQM